MPGSVVTVQLGQCGNQVRARREIIGMRVTVVVVVFFTQFPSPRPHKK